MTWMKSVPPKMIHDNFGVYKGFWMPEMDRCWIRKEDGLCVCSRVIRTKLGNVEHVTLTKGPRKGKLVNDGSGDLTWAEKQQIKNELFGARKTAIEVFPPEDRLVDYADVYHLWVFSDKNYHLPFGIHPKEFQHAINRGYSITRDELKELEAYYKERGEDVPGELFGISEQLP